MPDIVRLRFVGPAPVAVPAIGREVDPDCVVDLPGRILTDPAEIKALGLELPAADCFLAELGNPPRVSAFPTSTWRDETPVKKVKE